MRPLSRIVGVPISVDPFIPYRCARRARTYAAFGTRESGNLRMTKVRPALSTEEALDLVIGKLTMKVAAEVTDRKPHYLRALSDPDKREQLTVDDAVALDAAYVAAGHLGTPIFDSIGLRLRTAGSIDFHGVAVLTQAAIDMSREGSEAVVALLQAATPTLNEKALRHALKEVLEDQRVSEGAIRTIRCLLEHGAPCGPNDTS